MKRAMSMSSFPFLWVMEASRGTRPCCLRTPTVLMGTSGTAGGTENTGFSGDGSNQAAPGEGLPGACGPLTSCPAALGDWEITAANLACSSPPTEYLFCPWGFEMGSLGEQIS